MEETKIELGEMKVAKSPSLANLGKALSQAQAEYPVVPKNKTARVKMKTGGEYSYHYADIADVIKAVAQVNAKHGLCFFQIPQTVNRQQQLVTTILHESGEFIEGTLDLEPADRSPQSLGSAITYARRYGLGAMLGIATEEDEDGKLVTQGAATNTRSKDSRGSQRGSRTTQEVSTPATELALAFSKAGVTDPALQRSMVAAAMEDIGVEVDNYDRPPLLKTLSPERAQEVVAQVKLNMSPTEVAE